MLLTGFFIIQLNQARVLILLGDYKGTVRDEGFHRANPFCSRNAGSTVDVIAGEPITRPTKVSLRARTYNGERLKVNDKCGNPIEIADAIVWRVENAAKALFDVDDCNAYVHAQSETALRHVATTYAYDRMLGDPRAMPRCVARAEHGNAVPVGRNAAVRVARRAAARRQAMAKREQHPLRIDSKVWAGIERWVADDSRSVNAQV